MRISDWSSDVCSSDLLMLTGMALFRAQMLTGAWPAARYRQWAVACFAVAVPPLAALAVWQARAGFDGVTVFGATTALLLHFDLVMTLGWAALILWLIGVRSEEHKSELQSLRRNS